MEEQKQIVLDILTNPTIAEKLRVCLENISSNDPIFKTLNNIFTRFPTVHKTPKGIHQVNIIHSTFQFSDPEECFTSFQFVSKSWHDAFKTLRFDYLIRILPESFFLQNVEFNWKKIFEKFQKVDIVNFQLEQIHPEDFEHFINIFKNAFQNLTEVSLPCPAKSDEGVTHEFFDASMEILHRSQNTLREIHQMRLAFFNNGIKFPNLQKIEISFKKGDTLELLKHFISSIEDSIPSLKSVDFSLSLLKNKKELEKIQDYFLKHHANKFLETIHWRYCTVPVKYVFHFELIEQNLAEYFIQNELCSEIEYIVISMHIQELRFMEYTEENEKKMFQNFEKILKLPKLKKIGIFIDSELCSDLSENLSPELLRVQNLVKSYSNIEFVSTNEIIDQCEKESENKLVFALL